MVVISLTQHQIMLLADILSESEIMKSESFEVIDIFDKIYKCTKKRELKLIIKLDITRFKEKNKIDDIKKVYKERSR